MDILKHCLFIFILMVNTAACLVVGVVMLSNPTTSREQGWGLITAAILSGMSVSYYIYYLFCKTPDVEQEMRKENTRDLHQTLLSV
jgi:hypothetical protein